MRPRLAISILTALAALSAAALDAPAGIPNAVEAVRSRLDPVLLTYDLLVEPGKDVALEAAYKSGLRLQGVEGKRLRFRLGEKLLGEAATDREGHAAIPWKVPEAAGDYVITVRLDPADQPERPVPGGRILVAARKSDAKLAVIDLDKTLVASGFGRVLAGGAKPMEGAGVVVSRLAKDHTIIYLTHRPDLLAPESKAWLAENGFPVGPLLTSTLASLMTGSGAYKSDRLEAIRKTYPNVEAGIGDKFSDARAYAQNGARAILILHVNWAKDDPQYFDKLADQLDALPDPVEVVTNWAQIADVLFAKAHQAKGELAKRLRDVAAELRRHGED
jgi:hypothetical protein